MRREELHVADLVDNARAVREYLNGVTRERWDADRVLRDAVLYRMLLLGIRAEFPDLAKAYGQAAKPETEPDLRGDDPDA
jgi:uncharacterized protein with HEPN domain